MQSATASLALEFATPDWSRVDIIDIIPYNCDSLMVLLHADNVLKKSSISGHIRGGESPDQARI